MNKKKKIIIFVVAIIIAIGCSSYIYSANKKSDRKDVIESLSSEVADVNEIETYMKDLDYKSSSENTGTNKFSFYKNSDDMIDTIYSSYPVPKHSFLYVTDYNEGGTGNNLILTRAYEDREIVYSIYSEDSNYIKIEVSYYKVCEENCDSTNYEVKFDHYLYNIDKGTLKAESTNNNTLTKKDVKDDIDYYFKELSRLY